MPEVITGLDKLAAGKLRLKGRIGLLVHPASVDRRVRHAYEVLRDTEHEVVTLFGPEHGAHGAAQDMIPVDGQTDFKPGSVDHPNHFSLYGSTSQDLVPKPEMLEGLDHIIIDLQDVGSRYYTYVWSAAFMLRVAAAMGVKVIVLDRPNPLGGEVTEGQPQRNGYRSFIGLYDVAVRHGMTIGEICTMVVEKESLPADCLEVVKMDGWSRKMYFDETELPWVMPSPNMPTLDTAIVYPGGCAIEGTLFSEGRGTTRPFEIWGAPNLDTRPLLELSIPGATLRPLSFLPTFQKHAGVLCHGVQLHVDDRSLFRSHAAYLRMIACAASTLGNAKATWRTEAYEYETSRPAIDLLTGGPKYRQVVNNLAGFSEYAKNRDVVADLGSYIERESEGARRFCEQRTPWLLYR